MAVLWAREAHSNALEQGTCSGPGKHMAMLWAREAHGYALEKR